MKAPRDPVAESAVRARRHGVVEGAAACGVAAGSRDGAVGRGGVGNGGGRREGVGHAERMGEEGEDGGGGEDFGLHVELWLG